MDSDSSFPVALALPVAQLRTVLKEIDEAVAGGQVSHVEVSQMWPSLPYLRGMISAEFTAYDDGSSRTYAVLIDADGGIVGRAKPDDA